MFHVERDVSRRDPEPFVNLGVVDIVVLVSDAVSQARRCSELTSQIRREDTERAQLDERVVVVLRGGCPPEVIK